jgi:hypothetical protein
VLANIGVEIRQPTTKKRLSSLRFKKNIEMLIDFTRAQKKV